MKNVLINKSVLNALKELPDESVDCVVSSPPQYGLRDYSAAQTYYDEDKERVIKTANEDMHRRCDNLPDFQRSRYYLTEPAYNDKENKWYVSLKYDVTEIWGGKPDCKHDWLIHSKFY